MNKHCLLFLFIVLVFSLCNAVPGAMFWPGVFSPDTFMQLENGLGKTPYFNNHPVTMSYLMGLMTIPQIKLFYYLAFQLLLISILGAISVYVLLQNFSLSTPKKYLYAAFLAIFLSWCPPNGIFSIIVWKDIPFAWLSFLLVVLVSDIWRNWSNLENNKAQSYVKVLGIGLVAGFAMHFRHNAYTISMTGLAVAGLALLTKAKTSRTFALKSLAFMCLGFAAMLSARTALKHALMPDPAARNYYDDFDVKSFVIRADFMLALALGIPLSDNERAEVSQYIDIQKSLETIKIDNSVYAIYPVFVGKREEIEPEFIKVAEKILKNHVSFWFFTKARYTAELITSVRGYHLPLFFDEVPEGEALGVHLSPPKKLSALRQKWIGWMRLEPFGRYSKAIFWTFWPVFFGYLFLIGVTLFRLKKFRPSFQNLSPFVSVVFAFALWGSLALVSSSNDFRYFWPSQFFLGVGLIHLFTVYKSKETA